jgi:DNA-binding transcriptional regulator YdaS (Cro superfamily)
MPNLKSHIERAIGHYGSQAKLAEAMGCSQQQIAYLLKASSISAEMALKIDAATNGEVSKHKLRPDIFGKAPPIPSQGRAA